MSRLPITGVVLAGGKGRRLGGQDKGWVEIAGRPLIRHVLDALAPQVDELLINANRNQERYRDLGHPVLDDPIADYAGPLAGLAAALAAAHNPWVLMVPCDAPRMPADLAERLYTSLQAADAAIAVAHDGERLQPVHALVACDRLDDLRAFLAEGGRKIDTWYARHPFVTVDFSDQAAAFANVNDADQRAALERELNDATA